MPNWKKVIVSGSDASLNSLLVSSNIAIGTSSLGSSENTLVLGPPPAGGAGEGGQILLQASGGIYTSASMLDNWQNFTRLLRGSNQSSDAVVTQWNMHTKQISFPAYNSVSAFAGTAVANLAVDSGGNILTVSTSGGSVFPYTGVASINGGLIVTGSITASGAIHAQANGQMYFRGGDDAELWDINVTNTVGIYGQQDQGVASIKLGSGGGTISGRSGSIGIGTTTPNSASLHVSGNVFATSFTGSFTGSLTGALTGTASWANNAVTSSYITSSNVYGPYGINSILSASYASGSTSASFAATASFAPAYVLTSATGSMLAPYVLNSQTSSFVTNAQTSSFVTNSQTSSFVLNSQTSSMSVLSASFASTASSADNFTVRGTLTAQTIVVQTITASIEFLTGSTKFGDAIADSHQFTGSVTISGSLSVVGPVSGSFTGSYTGSLTGSLFGTASWAQSASNAVTAAFATSASWAPGGGGASFPYTGSAVITGSLVVTGSFDLGIAEFNSTSSATTAGTTIVSSYATGSANSAFYNYYISSGSNARAGQIMSVWSGSTINYTEVTTNDLGNTNTASLAVTLATGNVRLSFTAPGVWTVKSIVNLL